MPANAEHRSTDAEPFQCPIPTFEATVAALDKLKPSKTFSKQAAAGVKHLHNKRLHATRKTKGVKAKASGRG